MKAISILVLWLSLPKVWSINANPNTFKEMQPDGTYVELHIAGNEYNNQLVDNQGYTVTKSNDWIVYAEEDQKSGTIQASSLIAGRDNPSDSGLMKGIKTSNDYGSRYLRRRRRRKTKITQHNKLLKNLVILIKFSNHNNRKLPSKDQINVLFNSLKNDPILAPTGSVRQFFLKNSYGKLDLESWIYPDWIVLPESESYYKSRFSEAVHYALGEMDKLNFSFGNFDSDSDGVVDFVTILHSGYGAEWGATDCYGQNYQNRIWSHKSSTSWKSKLGKTVMDYNVNPALSGTCGSEIGRIGVLVHEISHSFDLPDLYDTNGGNGIGSYDVMSNCWGYDGSQLYPPMLSAWSKIKAGWVTPKVISRSGYYDVPTGLVYKIQIGFPSGEYLLIENRQPKDFDSQIPQGGLAIWHIDEHAELSNEGFPGQIDWPYNGNHYRVALLQADGFYDLERGNNFGNAGDLWHGNEKNYIGPSMSVKTGPYPNTDSYQNGVMRKTGIVISQISCSNESMRFKLVV